MIKNSFSSLRIAVEAILSVLRLDYLSCVLTIVSTILVGRRCWEGWALAGANCVVMCIIGIRTAQLGFIPANVFCMVMSAINLRAWRRSRTS
jgi:nicotinamide riboside transporter PnuC